MLSKRDRVRGACAGWLVVFVVVVVVGVARAVKKPENGKLREVTRVVPSLEPPRVSDPLPETDPSCVTTPLPAVLEPDTEERVELVDDVNVELVVDVDWAIAVPGIARVARTATANSFFINTSWS